MASEMIPTSEEEAEVIKVKPEFKQELEGVEILHPNATYYKNKISRFDDCFGLMQDLSLESCQRCKVHCTYQGKQTVLNVVCKSFMNKFPFTEVEHQEAKELLATRTATKIADANAAKQPLGVSPEKKVVMTNAAVAAKPEGTRKVLSNKVTPPAPKPVAPKPVAKPVPKPVAKPKPVVPKPVPKPKPVAKKKVAVAKAPKGKGKSTPKGHNVTVVMAGLKKGLTSSTAIRLDSGLKTTVINTILKRFITQGVVSRKPDGNTFVYTLK